MAFIYNLTDSWNDVTTTWNGIKLAVTNTASDSSSKLLNLTVSGATTASFVVDKSGNLELNGSVNKVTITAPATAATFTLADNSTFATVGAHSATFTFTGTTAVTFPTSGIVTALGNSTTGSGDIVLATSPTLVTPNLGTPSAVTLTNATGLPVSTGISGFGTGVAAALGVNIGSGGAFVVYGGALGTPSSGNLSNCTGYTVGNISGLGSGVATWLGTPSSSNLRAAVTDETGTGSLVFATSPSLVTPNLGTPSAVTLTNATGLPISTGVSGLGSGVATFLATPSSANLASAVTDETGSGSLVFGTSPTIATPTITGTATFNGSTSGTVAVKAPAVAGTTTFQLPAGNGTSGYVLVTDGLGNTSWAASGGAAGNAAGVNKNVQFNDAGSMAGNAGFNFDKATDTLSLGVASTTSGNFALYNSASANAITIASGNNSAAWTLTLPTSAGTNGYALVTDGSGNTSWSMVSSGLAVGSTAISGGTSGRILYDNAGTLGEKAITGTGDVVLATSPTLVTPTLGVASATSVNKVAITAPATGSTLTIADGKTLTASNTLTFTGTDSSSVAFGTGGTVLYNGGALGTPSSGTLTNCTGYTVGNLSGAGTGVVTALGNATNGASGLVTLNASSQLPALDGSSLTALNASNISSGTLAVARGGSGATATTGTGNNVLSASPTFTGTISGDSASLTGTLAMGSSFLRNRIINGDMRIDQRNAGASVTPSNTVYTIDRWKSYLTTGVYSVQQVTDAPAGFVSSLKVTVTTPQASLGAGDYYAQLQLVEGYNMSDFSWGTANAQTVTLSFWVKSTGLSYPATLSYVIQSGNSDRSYVQTFSISASNVWQKITATIPGPTSGTYSSTNGTGLIVFVGLGSGSNFSTSTLGSWVSANVIGATGQTNLISTAGSTIYITGVQLEVGSVATPFERRQYGQELMLCQRYYYRITSNTDIPIAGLYVASTTSAIAIGQFPVSMRTSPSALEQTGTAANYQVRAQATSTACSAVPAFATATTDVWSVTATVASGLTAGNGGALRGAATGAYLGWSAEL